MGRWIKPEVYPLMAAMTFVTSMCVFQLTRNVFLNPDVRVNKANRSMGVLDNKEEGEKYAEHSLRKVNKANRSMGVLDNKEEGEKYAEHSLRKFLRTRPPEIMPTINHFFSEDK
ncbi:NADH-ubiquinone reductase complex 1 MLRQ subunit [Trema orientale]|uniref:NADH-ubiquinone reductase complex 1 MLRQ subunit n=1 Tax=Trema orientale TaxID=63057 RepID=A0A2P5E967_TREOI|nr:NADH-ubiquinone reductase complex 1 MLRQ subunit [Trema orientale]